MSLARIHAAEKVNWTRDHVSARQLKSARSDQDPRTIKAVCHAKAPRQFNRFTARDQSRPLAILDRRDHHRARAHPEVHVAFRFAIGQLGLAELFDHVQRHPHSFIAMVRIYFRKTKERDHALGISGLNISTRLHESVGRPADKLFRDFAEHRRLKIFRQIVFVRDVANNHRRFVSFRFRIKGNVAVDHTLELVFRQSIAEKYTRGHGPTALRDRGIAIGHDKCDCDREHGR